MATHYRTCPFCEATCGLEIEIEGREVVSVRGDAEDVFSHGFICPKGSTLKQLHEDPDRLRTPMVRGEDGELHLAQHSSDEEGAPAPAATPALVLRAAADAVPASGAGRRAYPLVLAGLVTAVLEVATADVDQDTEQVLV